MVNKENIQFGKRRKKRRQQSKKVKHKIFKQKTLNHEIYDHKEFVLMST